MSELPSLKTRLTIMGVSCAITAGVCEGLVRLADDNATPMIRLFSQTDDGEIGLLPNASARIASPVGEPWEIHTNDRGNRVSPVELSDQAWIAVGDSQVMGNGVADESPFPALVQLDGEAAHNLGVPGFGVGDALWKATKHLDAHPAQGVIVIINQMNDWEEVLAPVDARYQVRGGWLLDYEDAAGPRGSFLSSPLSRSHLFFLIGHLMLKDWSAPAPEPPQWLTDPASQRDKTLRIVQAVTEFAAAHPDTLVLPVFLPADVYATAERAEATPLKPFLTALSEPAWEDHRLAEQVLTTLASLEPVDLTPVLSRGEHFLEGDYHLSEKGHAAVADAISAAVVKARAHPADETP